MIIEKGSELKVLRNFCREPFEYFSIAELSKKTKISRNWMYKIIDKFKKAYLLLEYGKKYKLDFSNMFCQRLKFLFDAEFLDSLKMKNRIFDITNKIIFELDPKSVILVGSVSQQKMKEGSDIDFLVIGSKKEVPYFENTNIIVVSEKGFKEKYLKADDFVISALVFGKTIYDAGFFIRFYENPLPVFSQEVIQEKIKYCERLEERTYKLLKTDVEKAKEELLYLALQSARIILLKNKIIPKTKYDIASQIMVFNREFAEIINSLLRKKKIKKEKVLEYLEKFKNF
ncbi:MAG: nucleotidyltransferase domain-containing protein [Candidatus Aenigmarchaeota archaeon]|nr:nucleotidyltransferase domain-containing protein [Candidatus Aenigmarchaeota archaeon]